MSGILKFYNVSKDILVTLTPRALKTFEETEYDFVILGDEAQVADNDLVKMTSGESFADWARQ